MPRLALTMLLVFTAACAARADQSTGNPRNYPINILAETFGYSESDVAVPLVEIFQGCPRRDCIPSVDEPAFVKAIEAVGLAADDLLLVVEFNGVQKAYPTRYLDRHEIVNDEFGGKPVAVTYCPLCGSGLAFLRTVKGEPTEFGVSGLLHNNDLIMYDRATQSLWQQITGEAFAGPRRGNTLVTVPSIMTTFGAWRELNPDARVLGPPSGDMTYTPQAYDDYDSSDRLLFPVRLRDARLHLKRPIIGIEVAGLAIAVDVQWLSQQGGKWSREVNGRSLVVDTRPDGGIVAAYDGQPVPAHRMFWFAWYSFHPDTALITGDG